MADIDILKSLLDLDALEKLVEKEIRARTGRRFGFTLFIWADDTLLDERNASVEYAHVSNMKHSANANALRQASDNFDRKRQTPAQRKRSAN